MKKQGTTVRWTTIYSLLTLLVLPSVLPAASEHDASVADHMKAINRGFKELRRQLADPGSTQANLTLISELKERVKGARKGEPSMTSGLAESERGPFLEAYRSVLDEVIGTLDKLGVAVKENRLEEASTLVKQLNELKKKGHNKFQE
jgi:soluble cytochrome b562